jgi:hypothetical protein
MPTLSVTNHSRLATRSTTNHTYMKVPVMKVMTHSETPATAIYLAGSISAHDFLLV